MIDKLSFSPEQPFSISLGKRTLVTVNHLGTMAMFLDGALEEVEELKQNSTHWMCKGKRSIAAAVTLLQQDKIIAIPTDTIYGLAGLMSSPNSIEKLYEIKSRDKSKPLSISIHSVCEIKRWAVVDHLPQNLLPTILPGPYTVILKRTSVVNAVLNPNHDTVGIRVPCSKFITCVTKLVGPLALTSANVSNQPSCLYPSEFENLWPMLGGIFHDSHAIGSAKPYRRKGSTIVDLTKPEKYKIVRFGINANQLINTLAAYGLKADSD